MVAEWIAALNGSPPCDTFPSSRARCAEIWDQFGDDRGFRRFTQVVRRWQTDFIACAEMRAQASTMLEGITGESPAASLLRAIACAEPCSPILYRGQSLPLPDWEILARFAPGEIIDLPLASFTSSHIQALEFAWLTHEAEEGTEVILVLESGAKAFRIDLLAPDQIHWREREWVAGGRFAVTYAATSIDSGHVEIHLRQVGYADDTRPDSAR